MYVRRRGIAGNPLNKKEILSSILIERGKKRKLVYKEYVKR